MGYIYKIYSENNDKCYIGSTKMDIVKRLRLHKNAYKRFLQNKFHFLTSFSIVQHPDCEIEILETCDDAVLEIIEGQYINNYKILGLCINKKNANCNTREYKNEYYRNYRLRV
jgi:hypothetical protein